MTGPEHYREAERLLEPGEHDMVEQDLLALDLALAQVHATLALVMAIADPLGYGGRSDSQWTDAAGTDASFRSAPATPGSPCCTDGGSGAS